MRTRNLIKNSDLMRSDQIRSNDQVRSDQRSDRTGNLTDFGQISFEICSNFDGISIESPSNVDRISINLSAIWSNLGLRGIRNRPKIGPGAFPGHPRAPQGVPRAPQGAPRSAQEPHFDRNSTNCEPNLIEAWSTFDRNWHGVRSECDPIQIRTIFDRMVIKFWSNLARNWIGTRSQARSEHRSIFDRILIEFESKIKQ